MGRPACELFDLMVGTSTGGILALGLSRPDSKAPARFTAQQVVELYEHHGAQIFEYSLWRKFRTAGGILEEAYSHANLEKILRIIFQARGWVNVEYPPWSPVTISTRKTVFLKSWQSDHHDILCKDAARATSAAPTYFEPKPLDVDEQERILIDGGIFINSPSVSAYAEAIKLFPDEQIKVLSLGTGELTRSIPYHEAKPGGARYGSYPSWTACLMGSPKRPTTRCGSFLGSATSDCKFRSITPVTTWMTPLRAIFVT